MTAFIILLLIGAGYMALLIATNWVLDRLPWRR